MEAGKTAARRAGWAGMAAELTGALWLGEGVVKGQEAAGTASRQWWGCGRGRGGRQRRPVVSEGGSGAVRRREPPATGEGGEGRGRGEEEDKDEDWARRKMRQGEDGGVAHSSNARPVARCLHPFIFRETIPCAFYPMSSGPWLLEINNLKKKLMV